MVRREEQPWQSRATLFLDNRTIAHRGQGIAGTGAAQFLDDALRINPNSARAHLAVALNKRIDGGEELTPKMIAQEAEAGDKLSLELIMETA